MRVRAREKIVDEKEEADRTCNNPTIRESFMINRKKPYEISSIQPILQDLQHQVKERRIRFSASQIMALLASIALCFLVLSTQFNLSFLQSVLITILMASVAGLILYLIRKLK